MSSGLRSLGPAPYDIFLDLSGSTIAGDGLERYLRVFTAHLPPIADQRITAATPDRSTVLVDGRLFTVPDTTPALAHAVDLAHVCGRGLFVIRGGWTPSSSALHAISGAAALDPNIGTVQPRFAVGASGDLLVLPGTNDATVLPRPIASMLPQHYVTPEIDAACTYITPQGIPACGTIRRDAGSAALIELSIGLRRRGFRNLIANRVIVDYPLAPALAYREHLAAELAPDIADDFAAGVEWRRRLPAVKLEGLLSHAMSGESKRLLLDCRGMTPAHNGSAHAILGYLLGISRLQPKGWEITVCVGRNAATFHDLDRRFPDFRYEYDRPRSKHLVAIHLSQPWSMQMVIELHEAAPLIAFNILDTIAWDAIYPAPSVLDQVTRFAARFADGLTYLSEYSRQRFRFRFPTHDRMVETVTYLSMSPSDYGTDGSRVTRKTIGILIMGNHLDHKDVARTTEKLADAFPYEPIVAFGSAGVQQRSNVRMVPSGYVSEASLRDLFERASMIVYPSFSEGFGIPVVEGLALGKPVVVRELPLWDEIRLQTGSNGQLRTFRTDAELIEAVGAALQAHDTESQPPKSTATWDWSKCADSLMNFAGDLVANFSIDQWQGRDLALAGGSVT